VPKLIARFRTRGPRLRSRAAWTAIAQSTKAEIQLSVFGRRGSRPFNLEEMQRLYLRGWKALTVTDTPPMLARP